MGKNAMTIGKQPPKSSHEKRHSEKAQQAETQGQPKDAAKSPGGKRARFPTDFQLEPGRTSGIAGYAARQPAEREPASGKGGKAPPEE
jgi:hypothetical protein